MTYTLPFVTQARLALFSQRAQQTCPWLSLDLTHENFAMPGVRKRLAEEEETGVASSSAADVQTPVVATSSRSVRQRVSASADPGEGASQSPAPDGPLIRSLKRDWSRGILNARQIQEYASGARDQGAEGLDRLASSGGGGRHATNVHKSLLSMFGTPTGGPPIDWVELTTKQGDRVPHPVIFPHKFFASLYRGRRAWFDRHIRGPPTAAAEYWSKVGCKVFLQQHGYSSGAWARVLPIGLHGDAGAYSKQDSLMVVSWNSLLGFGNTQRKRFVFTFVLKSVYTRETLDQLWRIFGWSVNALLAGTSPSDDWLGRPLSGGGETIASGYRACVCQVRGDWQFYCEVFRFPAWNGASRMCWICPASGVSSARVFTNCKSSAAWRSERYTHESYLAMLAARGAEPPTLFSAVKGLRLECITVDALHALDLGLAQHIAGNVLWESVASNSWGGGNQQANIDLMERDLRRWEKEHSVKRGFQGRLTKERLRSESGYPKLKAKGAQTRHLANYILDVARRFDSGTQHDRKKIAVAQLLVRVYEIMASAGQFLSPGELADFEKVGRGMVALYSDLYAEAATNGRTLWKFPPKAHLIDHMVTYQSREWGNPSYFWCYADEDLVGMSIEIAKSCHQSTMAATALVKWLVVAFDADD